MIRKLQLTAVGLVDQPDRAQLLGVCMHFTQVSPDPPCQLLDPDWTSPRQGLEDGKPITVQRIEKILLRPEQVARRLWCTAFERGNAEQVARRLWCTAFERGNGWARASSSASSEPEFGVSYKTTMRHARY